MTRVAWSALLIVLMRGASTDAFAQSVACYAMTRGESAAQAARRVTGNDQNAYQQWFQIMDPSARFVPKSQYNRIRAGWRACVIKPAVRSASSNANRVAEREAADVSEASIGSDVPAGADVPAALAPTPLARAGIGSRQRPAASNKPR